MTRHRPARESRDGSTEAREPQLAPRFPDPGSPRSKKSTSAQSSVPQGKQSQSGKQRSGKSKRPRKSGPEGRAPRPASNNQVAGDDVRLVRLNKYLASHGIGSRRRCDQLIEEGGVMIDEDIVTDLGVKVDPTVQRIEVDGVVLKPEGLKYRYYLLNKPSGVVCTNDQREAKPRAIDLITDKKKGRIYTVGRLDEDTFGLVILTNDGDFAHQIMHPRYEVPKTYHVKLLGRIDDDSLQKIRRGVHLAEGKTGSARVVVMQRSSKVSRLAVTLLEGKNREIRRVFARMGFKVVDLKRVRIGSINDRGVKVGHWRPLSRGEVNELLEIANSDRALIDEMDDGRRESQRRSKGRRSAPRRGGPGRPQRSR